jgi:RNA polymerase sigma factor (sigma-70 family)
LADRDQVWRLLRALPAKQRAAIVLRYYHDLSDADIAAALECREGTVRSLISRGLAALRVTPEDRSTTGGGRR